MSHHENYSIDIIPYWLKNRHETEDRIANAEGALPHKIFSVDDINEMLKRKGWTGPVLKDKYTEDEIKERRSLYRELHQKYVRRATKSVLAIKRAEKFILAGQQERGEKQCTDNGDRYPEELLYNLDNTEKTDKANAELMQVFIDAANIGNGLRKREQAEAQRKPGENPPEKTEEEKQEEAALDKLLERRDDIEKKFNKYHEDFLDKVSNYPLDDILRHTNDDKYLVNNFDKITDLIRLSIYCENMKSTYEKCRITMPDNVAKTLEKLAPELSIFQTLGMRMDFIDTPYYSELDIDDPVTRDVLGSEMMYDISEGEKDNVHPATHKGDLSLTWSTATGYKLFSLNAETLAAKKMLLEMGVSPDNMMVQYGNRPAEPFLANDDVRSPVDMQAKYDDLIAGRVDHIVIYDKTDPLRTIELPKDLIKNTTVSRAWRDARKNPLPRPVEKAADPGFFKRMAYKIFGKYKEECEPYYAYEKYQKDMKKWFKKTGLQDKSPSRLRQQREQQAETERATAKANAVNNVVNAGPQNQPEKPVAEIGNNQPREKIKIEQPREEIKNEEHKEEQNEEHKEEKNEEHKEEKNENEQNKEEIKIEQPREEIKNEQPKEEIKNEQPREEIKNEQPREEIKIEQPKEEIKNEAHKEEEIKNEQPKEEIMIEEHEEEIKNKQPKEEQNKNEAPKEEQNKEEIKIEEKPKFAPQPEIEDMYYQFSKEENEAMRTWYTSAGAAYENGKFNFVSERNKNIKVPADRKTAIATLGLKGLTYVNNRLKDINIKSATNYMVLTRDMVKAIGVYQMFYDEKGNLKQDEYEKLGKNRKMGDFLSIVEGSTEILTESDLTTKQYAEKLAKKEPIFSKETQNMIMEKYQKKFVKNKPVNADVPAGVPADVPADVSKDPENTVEEKKPSIEEKKPGIEKKKPGM